MGLDQSIVYGDHRGDDLIEGDIYFRKWWELHEWLVENQPETFGGNYYGEYRDVKPEVCQKLRKLVTKLWERYERTGKLYHLDNSYFRKLPDEWEWDKQRGYLEQLYIMFHYNPHLETFEYEADW